MAKACVICGGDETSGETLLEAPCQRHWVCTDDVGSFFERATENESLYPPKCCGQIFSLDLYEAYVPFDVQWAYQMKEQGEYSVLAKYRVYCANPSCSQFLSPATHVKDSSTDISYAICQDEGCGKLTCTSCKTLVNGVEGHTCDQNEDYKKFKQTVTEKGFQECPDCASTVELAEACNHITCECGAEFCYICGQQWQVMHGCPLYGPAIYDEEGYNQDGFHQTTGLNREGRTRREQARVDQEEHGNDDDDDDEEDEDPDANHPVLQHVEPGVRATFAALPREEREMFLVNLQIQLFEERGITFGNEGGEDDSGREGDEDGASSGSSDGEEDDQDGDGEVRQINDEEADGTGQNDNAEEEGQNNVQPDVNMVEDGTIENLDVAIATAAAMQAFEGSVDLAAGPQAFQELNVEQYISRLHQINAGYAYDENDSSGAIDDATAIARHPAWLASTLQMVQHHIDSRLVSQETIHGALILLEASNRNTAHMNNIRLLLSSVSMPSYLNNPGRGEMGGSSSATSLGDDQPTTPMDIDPADEQPKEERPIWQGQPGGWSIDEEL